MSGFSIFVPSSGYPQPTNRYVHPPGVPLPTNSWSENAVKGTVFVEGSPPGVFPPFPPTNRDTKPVPWCVSPYYGDGVTPTPFITLGHDTVGDVTHSNQEGQNSIFLDPRGFVDQLTPAAGGVTLDLVNLDEGSASYLFSNGTEFHTSRGSPFIALFSTGGDAVDFLTSSSLALLGPAGVVSEVRGTFHYLELPFTRKQVTTSVTSRYPLSGVYTFNILVWSRYTLVGTIRVTMLTFNPATGQPITGNFSLNGVSIGSFSLDQFGNPVLTSDTGATYDPLTKTITTLGGITINLSTPPVFTVQYTEPAVPGVIRFISNGPFTAVRSGGTVTLTTGPNSHLLVYVNDARTYYTDPLLGYVTRFTVTQGTNGSYSVSLTKQLGTSNYFYTPRWWRDQYNVSGVTFLTDVVYDVTYGDCILAVAQQATLVFTPLVALVLPTGPVLPDVGLNLQAFQERIVLDTQYYRELTLAAYTQETAYVFGQNIAKYGRILLFAQVTGILLPSMYAAYVSLLTSWLNETNGQVPVSAPGSNTFALETTWGGVITRADYNVSIGTAGEGSFGNSFYNDHHFQYGYFFSALHILNEIGQGATLLVFQNQIRQLLQDVVTPSGDASSISIKTRHKDWYFGHSWAPGLTGAVNIDQESVSEAINCYYQAWLLSGTMYALTLDIRFKNMQDISVAALYNEIYAYRYFWTQNGQSIQAPSTTIVQAFSKTFAAFAPGQPTSYPSTSLYRYSIITLPFTDLTPVFLDRDWVTRIAAATTPDWQRVDRQLIAGLANYEKLTPDSWFYTPTPSPFDNNMDRSPEGITAWGFVGLQLLGLGGQITLEEALRYYNKVNFKGADLQMPLNEDIIKRFCSFSNCFYVLYAQANYNELTPVELDEDNIDPATLLLGERIQSILLHSRVFTPQKAQLYSSRRGVVKKCPNHPTLVEVPMITIEAVPDASGLDVASVTFTVTDIIDYTKCGSSKLVYDECLPVGLVPARDVYITTFILEQPKCNFNSVLNENGSTLLAKCRNLNAIANYIIQYTYARWILARLLYGKFKLKYLHRDFTEKFFRDLVRSRFFLFYSEYFMNPRLIDYNGRLYNVIGYGNVPQHGEFYFVP